MASSSSSSSPSLRSWKYDVFLSFRGEDTRKTFVDHLYTALQHHRISTYKDDVTLDRGDTIGPSLMKAIEESQIAVVVFSGNYADSSWCLEELEHIMKCRHERGQIVLPIFYNVDPSHVRKQRRKYEEAFAKHTLMSHNKVETWRKALVDASNISGWETKEIANGHEATCIKIIVGNIQDKLLSVNSDVDEDLVGMGSRCQYFESLLNIGSGGVRMIGIWGLGGGGKTTLAFSIYMKIRERFHGHCFIGNIREEAAKYGLQKLQEKVLSEVLKKQMSVASVQEGRCDIKKIMCRRNVLIVLDDVDDVEQMEALAGSCNWFGEGSRIIITTRDEQVLISRKVEVSPISLLSDDEAIRLFRKYAYNEDNPVKDYDELSLRVIDYVNGLPLALKIIGSFLYDKDKIDWIDALDKLREIPNRKVTDQLKISYDGLDSDEKELFLDIACFFRGVMKDNAMEILDACGFHPCIGVTVLIQKSLIAISSDGKFDMHDLVQEMGHHIVRGEHPNNPEKHSRVWRDEDIEDMCARNAMENHKIEAIRYNILHDTPPAQGFMTLVSNLKKLRFLHVYCDFPSGYNSEEGPTFLSNDLKYIEFNGYPASSVFSESFQPRKLVVLKLKNSLQKELWKGYKCMPCLKELNLMNADALVRTPDIHGLSCLQKLIIKKCESLEEIDESLGNHTSIVYVYVGHCEKLSRFPTIVHMEKLETLEITSCKALVEFPKIEANMDSLVNLHLEDVGIQVLPSSVGRYCTNLISLNLKHCSKLESIEGNFHALKYLQKFKLSGCIQLEKLPKDLFNEKCCLEELIFIPWFLKSNTLRPGPQLPRLLRKLYLIGFKLKDGEIPCEIGELYNLQELNLCGNHFSRLDFSLLKLTRLKHLNLSSCHNLVELPELPSSIAILEANDCKSLEAIRDDVHRNCKWLCQVSISKSYKGSCGSFVGGERLLETMLQGMAIGNYECMSLNLKGIESIPKEFKRRLVRGNKCRLKLPNNWFSEYTGFLFCSVGNCWNRNRPRIMFWDSEDEQQQQVFWEEEEESVTSEEECFGNGGDSEDEQQQVFWEGSVKNHRLLEVNGVTWEEKEEERVTWVGYVSFGSLTHTAWLDQTSTDVHFSIDFDNVWDYDWNGDSKGFGVRLVSKKNQMKEETTTTTTNSSTEFSDDDYKCKFKITYDSGSLLKYEFEELPTTAKQLARKHTLMYPCFPVTVAPPLRCRRDFDSC